MCPEHEREESLYDSSVVCSASLPRSSIISKPSWEYEGAEKASGCLCSVKGALAPPVNVRNSSTDRCPETSGSYRRPYCI
jgi:hypothetical protein